ncbi:BON domain-containing protein [Poseidonocella sp. HB161398]|uniref:BON domain-containing protein n=1 Tax=Poseidonocella sp. HB161398 TaxID=2320855 RepID=UPI001109873F|nr:BON domain-containing protein [Poseidonocella sp. HB161398]
MNDKDLRKDILEHLDYEPSIDAAEIGVAVEDGTVTLSGHVRTYAEKFTAENIVKRIRGVRAIAEEIEVRPVGAHATADDEIAKRAVNTLQWNTSVPRDAVQVKVEDGLVTLSGSVTWQFEKSAAEKVVRRLSGVKSISNLIKVVPTVKAADIRQRIELALKRDAELEAQRIEVTVADRRVTLEGQVRTLAEREAVERAAWAAPGVNAVVDHIAIG